jgi:hypothetical protein
MIRAVEARKVQSRSPFALHRMRRYRRNARQARSSFAFADHRRRYSRPPGAARTVTACRVSATLAPRPRDAARFIT